MICRKSDPNSGVRCATLLAENKTLILPTDTVYGFSTVADEAGAKRIRRIKGRDENKPFIRLIAKPDAIFSFTSCAVPESLLKLWPGALTLIVPSDAEHCGSVALRCPGDAWLRDVIEAVGKPIFSTSVNRSGKAVLSNIEEILREFTDDVSLIVDDGDKTNALPSTIVKFDGNMTVIRQGAVRID